MLIAFVGICYFTSLISVVFGLFVFIKGGKKISNVWALMSISVALWSLGLGLMSNSPTEHHALLYLKWIHYVGAILIPPFYLHFVLLLLDLEKQKRMILTSIYVFSALILMANFLGYFATVSSDIPPFKYYTQPMLLYYPYTIVFFATVIYTIILLYQRYRKANGYRKNQIKYQLFATIVGFGGGGTAFFPVFHIPIFPYGMYVMFIYMVIMAYSITSYRLMDINVAMTRAGIFAFVYIIVLGIPFGLAGLGREWLANILGHGWFWVPMLVLLGLATVGPYIFIFLQRKAEGEILRGQRHNHTILMAAARGITLVRDFEKLLNLIVRILTRTLGIKHAGLYLFDQEKNRYAFRMTRGGRQNTIIIDPGNSLVKYLQGTRKPLVYEELKREYDDRRDVFIKEIIETMNNLDADVLVPSFIENELIGFLVLGAKKSGEIYSNEDLNVLSNLANQSALAIENAQFLKEREEMQAKLRKAGILVAMSDLLATFEHEMGNILGKISGPIQAMAKGDYKNNPDKEKNAVDMINTNITTMRTHVRYVREYREKTQANIIGTYRLADCIQRAFDHSRIEIEKLKITTETKFISSKIMIKGIETLPDIFNHLVVSSVNGFGMEEGGLISYNARLLEDKGMVEIIQEDTGFDLTQEKKNSNQEGSGIFFERGKIGGINLYLAQQIVSDHKGSFDIQSGNGKGTKFVIRLPLDFTKVTT